MNLAATTFERRDALVAWAVTVIPFAALVIGIGLQWQGFRLGAFDVALFVAFYAATIIGVEVGYHRYFSHGAFKCGTPMRVALAVLGSMSFQGPVIWWAASHRRHHKYSDRPQDPHSPHFHGEGVRGILRGLVHAHMGWMFRSGTLFPNAGYERYVPDLLRDRAILAVHFKYAYWLVLSLAAPALVGGAVTGTWRGALMGLLWSGLIRVFFVNHSIWSVNSLCHVYGRHELRSPDRSTNNVWLALPSFGASWHNNHHAFARTAVNQFEWWQLDLGGMFVRALERVGLAWDVTMPSRDAIRSRRLAQRAEDRNDAAPEDAEIAGVAFLESGR